MTLFTSDNVTPACPEVLQALIDANRGLAASYAEDAHTLQFQDRLCEIFETELSVYPCVTGTAANALALSALAPRYGKIYCHALSHINTDECGAPEFFTGGAKLVPVTGDDGKLTSSQLCDAVYGRGNVHHAQPAAVSIAQSCETGALYQIEEIASLAHRAHELGLRVHMDGARFGNAVTSLQASPAAMTWRAGVDVLSFGGTKNGCFAAEAVVFFNRDLAREFEFLHKRSGQLLSKTRFVSAQLNAYVQDDVWLRNARQANAMAKRLSDGLAKLPGIRLAYPTQANEVFAVVPAEIARAVEADGFAVNEDELDGKAARFVTAWNTQAADVDRLLECFLRHCTAREKHHG